MGMFSDLMKKLGLGGDSTENSMGGMSSDSNMPQQPMDEASMSSDEASMGGEMPTQDQDQSPQA